MGVLIRHLWAICLTLLLPLAGLAGAEHAAASVAHLCCAETDAETFAETGAAGAGAGVAAPSVAMAETAHLGRHDHGSDGGGAHGLACGVHACTGIALPEQGALSRAAPRRARFLRPGRAALPDAPADSPERPPAAFS